jgi:cell division protease FtsH
LPDNLLPRASNMSQETQRQIDQAIRKLVMDGFNHATTILSGNREILENSARTLLERETLDESTIRSLTKDLKTIPLERNVATPMPLFV